MLKLQNTEIFISEFKNYEKQINQISNYNAKYQGLALLNELKTQCNYIDEAHNSRNNGYIDPRNVRDNIEKLVQIRLQLNKLIKDSKEC
jgi:hypothetical protein